MIDTLMNSLPKHGSPKDVAGADFWYSRDYEPHWWPEGTGKGIRIEECDMTPEQIAEYKEGWNEAVERGERKDWG
tara:strand:- start:222 stop:446 length:225 start_codon:yes stop_codon:yes gene_type:complete